MPRLAALVLLVSSFASPTFSVPTPKPVEPENTKIQIVGTWEVNIKLEGKSVVGTYEFKADGELAFRFVQEIALKAKYAILVESDKVFIEAVGPGAQKRRSPIKSMSGNTLVIIDEGKTASVLRRKQT